MKNKAPKSQGWYRFEDGYQAWYYGLSADEKKNLIREHGPIIKFVQTK